ncbi:MAG: hypothetical protein LBI63_06150 [Candidatus Ancillula sp.]|jgi:hypothetical protein|nr:hypothetical protein [Candidatus Ancillula sp.]
MKCSIKKKVTTAVFALALGLFGVVVPTVIGVDTTNAGATTINDCSWSYNSQKAHNGSCFEVRHVSVSNNKYYFGSWVAMNNDSSSGVFSNVQAFGIDVHVASPETIFHRQLTVL